MINLIFLGKKSSKDKKKNAKNEKEETQENGDEEVQQQICLSDVNLKVCIVL